jgi:TPR repeat protein
MVRLLFVFIERVLNAWIFLFYFFHLIIFVEANNQSYMKNHLLRVCISFISIFLFCSTITGQTPLRNLFRVELEEMAKKGDPDAIYELALRYDEGIGTPVDTKTAMKYYKQLAKQGDYRSAFRLGELSSNSKQAVKWFDEAASLAQGKDADYVRKAEIAKRAHNGDSQAMIEMGKMYLHGEGDHNFSFTAESWFKKAAEAGNPEGFYALAEQHESKNWAYEKLDWYKHAAALGHTKSMMAIGDMYFTGQYIPQDSAEAVRWFRKAAEGGDPIGQNRLAECYDKGNGVPKDYSEAVKWYRKAAEQGYEPSLFSLSSRLLFQDEVKNYQEGAKWTRVLANKGNQYGQYIMGVCYQFGMGVDKDYTKAVQWYKKSSNQGVAEASSQLAYLYEKGYGVKKDLEEAKRLYKKAIDGGDESAKESLKKLEESMAYAELANILMSTAAEMKAEKEAKSRPTTGMENGHEWVDLGLSVKWATCNLEASSPSDFGGYFAWGEMKTKEKYYWTYTRFCLDDDGKRFERYNTKSNYGPVDNKTRLDLAGDAASSNWGGGWRTPTKEEINELISNCKWTWTTQEGKKGYKVTSKKNGNSIFLPAAGVVDSQGIVDGQGGTTLSGYWSSSLDTKNPLHAFALAFTNDKFFYGPGRRISGRSVRPVTYVRQNSNQKATKGTENGHEWVDLGLSIMWATCNVGASSPSDYGGYFAWGETLTKSKYSDNTSRARSDDAAQGIWGGRWRMPTKAEFDELISNCTWEWTTQGGKKGFLITSKKNGNSIFLPAGGFWAGRSNVEPNNDSGYYWSSSLNTDTPSRAWGILIAHYSYRTWDGFERFTGFSIRPVME